MSRSDIFALVLCWACWGAAWFYFGRATAWRKAKRELEALTEKLGQ